MPLLRNRMLPLRTITLRYVARNVELYWKKEWNPELQEITEASDDILLDLPSVLRWEIFSCLRKYSSLNTKALLLLLDHKTFFEDLEEPLGWTVEERNKGYLGTLMARRCKRSTSLSLRGLEFSEEPSSVKVLGTFTNLTSLRIYSRDCAVLKVIGRSLHKLEELFLDHLENDSSGAIECLVTGCPKLKILHVGIRPTLESIQIRAATLQSVQYVLLGLPNLIEFRHPLVVFALEKIIQDGKADRVSSLRTLYIVDGTRSKFGVTSVGVTDVYNPAQVVINHLINITKLYYQVPYAHSKELLQNLSKTVSTMSHLTELTWEEVSCTYTIVPIIEAVGPQLRSLNLRCKIYPCIDAIDQCRELRVLSITFLNRVKVSNFIQFGPYNYHPSYDFSSDLQEQFTAFQHLEKLHLEKLNHSHFKPALLKSLIASPVLQDLRLKSIPMFTDNIVQAAFSHANQNREQLAFTSLRKLEIKRCHYIFTDSLENVVTHERVPLEMLTIVNCSAVEKRSLWNLKRFDLTFTRR